MVGRANAAGAAVSAAISTAAMASSSTEAAFSASPYHLGARRCSPRGPRPAAVDLGGQRTEPGGGGTVR